MGDNLFPVSGGLVVNKKTKKEQDDSAGCKC